MIRSKKYLKDLDKRLLPYVSWCAKWGMTPPRLFGMAVVSALLSFVLISGGAELHILYLLGAIAIIMRYIFTRLGTLLICEYAMGTPANILVAELHLPVANAVAYFGFIMIDGVSLGLLIAVVITAIMIEMASIIAVPVLNKRLEHGPITQTELTLVFAGIALILSTGIPATLWVNVVLIVTLFFQSITLVRRIIGCT